MTGKTHLAFDVMTASTIAITIYNPDTMALAIPISFIGGSIIGCLLPDIDDPESIIGRCMILISFALKKLIGHRTYTHDPVCMGIIFAVLTYMFFGTSPFWIGLMIGYAGHLLLDSTNYIGIPICYVFHLFHKDKKAEEEKSKCTTIEELEKWKRKQEYRYNFHLVRFENRCNSKSSKANRYAIVSAMAFMMINIFVQSRLLDMSMQNTITFMLNKISTGIV